MTYRSMRSTRTKPARFGLERTSVALTVLTAKLENSNPSCMLVTLEFSVLKRCMKTAKDGFGLALTSKACTNSIVKPKNTPQTITKKTACYLITFPVLPQIDRVIYGHYR